MTDSATLGNMINHRENYDITQAVADVDFAVEVLIDNPGSYGLVRVHWSNGHVSYEEFDF